MKSNRGFTLLEVMVAIGIFAIVSVMAYSSLTRILTDRERLESEHVFWSALSLTFSRLEDDLSQARPRTVRDLSGAFIPAFLGLPTEMQTTAVPTLEFTRGGVFTFDSGPRSDLQRVGYQLVDGTLERVVWPVLDQAPQTLPQAVPLLKNVEQFSVRFFSPSTGAWVDQWPAPGINDTSPSGVEVKLTLKGRGEFTRLFLVNG
ncbi:MAG: type II secretion system minor pseudopilin GspJ [Sulfuricaulis sp.]